MKIVAGNILFAAIASAIGATAMYVISPSKNTVALSVEETAPATTVVSIDSAMEPLSRDDGMAGALERPPAVESKLELDVNVYDPPDPQSVAEGEISSTTQPAELDITALDLTWKPGEFIQKVCVVTLNGVSKLCVVTTVGVSVNGSEDLVYEASESSPMKIGTQLLVDNPSGECQDVASCVALVANDEDACDRFLESIDWLAWQLGIYSAYNNGIPGLEAYPRSWVEPVYFDAAGSNLSVAFGEDCKATTFQI